MSDEQTDDYGISIEYGFAPEENECHVHLVVPSAQFNVDALDRRLREIVITVLGVTDE